MWTAVHEAHSHLDARAGLPGAGAADRREDDERAAVRASRPLSALYFNAPGN